MDGKDKSKPWNTQHFSSKKTVSLDQTTIQIPIPMRKSLLLLLASGLLALSAAAQPRVSLSVDASRPVGEMNPLWAWFGYDEPNYTYMKDGRKLLSEIADLSPVPVYVRAHNLMTTGDGKAAFKWGSTNMYTEDAAGRPVYDWDIIDRIFDTYVDRGMRPLVEVGFMPEALTSKGGPYSHHWQPGDNYNDIYTAWTAPPKDYGKWAELVRQWVLHSIDRYGLDEVNTWYWELWNEPDIAYWSGSAEEYCKLYDYTSEAILSVLPTAKVGGPETTNPSSRNAAAFLRTFLDHVTTGTNYVTGRTGSHIDFISFHAKGAPRIVDGHIRMNAGVQLRNIDAGCAIVASYPTLKHLPVIIGESDPEGCAACGMKTNPENGYRNGTVYSSYTAATFARKYELQDRHGVRIEGAVTWAFEFEDQPWFNGFRDLATNGVDEPVLNVFRMFGKMAGQRVAVTGNTCSLDDLLQGSVRERDDVSAIASRSDRSVAVMVWDYHDDDLPREGGATVDLSVSGIPARDVRVTHYRIDAEHSNSYEVWKAMGEPQQPDREQYRRLEQAGQLAEYEPARQLRLRKGTFSSSFALPRQGTSLLLIEW